MSLRVYVGRFNPIHLGHEAVIENMTRGYHLAANNPPLIILGSANQPQSMRHFFSYGDRAEFIKELYPQIPIVGLPDYTSDTEWFDALDDILYAVDGEHHTTVEFFSGCIEDVQFFQERGCICNIADRYDGTTPIISATQVRTALLQGTSLKGLVNPQISDLIKERFDMRWKEFITK